MGFIGLGLLGIELARRAHAAGFDVVGHDINPQAVRHLKTFARFADSATAVAQECPRLVLTLPDSPISTQVISELEPSLARGAVIIDVTTGDPDDMSRLGRRLAKRGVRYLDATILGSSADVAAGNGLMMVGATTGDFKKNRDVFESLGPQQFHLGPCGSGARMKLVVNLVLGLNRAALAEGLAFARATGVDPSAAFEVLKAGLAYSRVMDAKGPKMLNRDFTPVARLSQHLKDVRLILAAARKANQDLPLSGVHEELLNAVAVAGGSELDNSAVILAYE